jgi:hypothetical protein
MVLWEAPAHWRRHQSRHARIMLNFLLLSYGALTGKDSEWIPRSRSTGMVRCSPTI